MANGIGLPPWLGMRPAWMCQAGFRAASGCWPQAGEVGEILVGRLRDHVEIEPLGAAGGVEHELPQRLGRRVAQPLLHRQAVALRLADFLRALIEEQLVGEADRRLAAEDAADAARQAHAVDQILARHLVIDAECEPAHRPVGLPLQLGGAARDRGLEPRRRSAGSAHAIVPAAASRWLDRHLHHLPGLGMDRQDRRVGRTPLRPERGQHDGEDFVEAARARAAAPRRTGRIG